ncbi:MAG: zf-HC2 domain-containing protein [Candidatus Latescibacterota bacterium]|nr:MAG: zf-HC2 domain-containing protein [Candidatus Latescibacterota bacterium]
MRCKEIAKLLSEQRDHGLPWYRRVMIRVHLAMCVFCRRLEKHLAFIHRLSEAAGDTADGAPLETGSVYADTLSQEARSRIKKAIAQHGY